MQIVADGDQLRAQIGLLRATAEPFTQPESIRLELVPGQGRAAIFEGDGPQPEALTYQGIRFSRA